GGPLRAIEMVQQVFGRRLEHGTQAGGNIYSWCLFCHLELLSAVANQTDGGLACPILRATLPGSKSGRAPGLVTSLEDPLLHTTTFGYNSLNELTSVTNALNHTVTYAYNNAGLVTG